MKYFLDTHVIVWRLINPNCFRNKIKAIFTDTDNVFYIPTMAMLEIQYLNEIHRIELNSNEAFNIIDGLKSFILVDFDRKVLLKAFELTGTRDPFDRIILAHAIADSIKIITNDRWMMNTRRDLVISTNP